jgi:hypothetical protein
LSKQNPFRYGRIELDFDGLQSASEKWHLASMREDMPFLYSHC